MTGTNSTHVELVPSRQLLGGSHAPTSARESRQNGLQSKLAADVAAPLPDIGPVAAISPQSRGSRDDAKGWARRPTYPLARCGFPDFQFVQDLHVPPQMAPRSVSELLEDAHGHRRTAGDEDFRLPSPDR